jgi:hypothetical protein
MKGAATIVLVGSASLVVLYAIAEGQSKQGQNWAPSVIKESLSIPEADLPELIKRAEEKETDAALKLASYFGMYLGDTKKEIHYFEIAAGNGSERALHNLMMIFASFPDYFDFERALEIRSRLKAIVAARKGRIDADNEWAYEMYLEHFVGLGNKPRGLIFLEYAAKHGSRRAAAELARIFSEDPDVADVAKARRWKAVVAAQRRAGAP